MDKLLLPVPTAAPAAPVAPVAAGGGVSATTVTLIIAGIIVTAGLVAIIVLATQEKPSIFGESALSLFNKSGDPWYPVRVELIRIFPDPNWDDGSLAPVCVRLAWHSSATYNSYTGQYGSWGGATMRFPPEKTDPDNKGLDLVMQRLEPLKQKFEWASYGDIYTFAGVVAISVLGGPSVKWWPGRVDTNDRNRVPPNGFLPDGALGNQVPKNGGSAPGVLHMRAVFSRLQCSDAEAIALMIGGHAIGRMHKDRSGFEGRWSHTPLVFSNNYAKALLNLKFTSERSPAGKLQFKDSSDKELTFMPIEMAILTDDTYRNWLVRFNLDPGFFYATFSRAYSKILDNGRPK